MATTHLQVVGAMLIWAWVLFFIPLFLYRFLKQSNKYQRFFSWTAFLFSLIIVVALTLFSCSLRPVPSFCGDTPPFGFDDNGKPCEQQYDVDSRLISPKCFTNVKSINDAKPLIVLPVVVVLIGYFIGSIYAKFVALLAKRLPQLDKKIL